MQAAQLVKDCSAKACSGIDPTSAKIIKAAFTIRLRLGGPNIWGAIASG
jgi:hypothetical protein